MAAREPVRVAVVFAPGKRLRPVWFERGGRQHKVVEITYAWHDRVGDKVEQHFAVTDGEALFELVYSPLEGTWMLMAQQAVT